MFWYFRHGRPWLLSLLVTGTLLTAGCGSDNPTSPPGPTAVNGNVNKAPLVGANVDIHQINTDGTIGAHVAGPFVTDANGNWTGSIGAGTPGPFVLVATGGSYVDEATGSTILLAAGRELYGLLQGVASQVTPVSHATFLAMQALVTGGTTLADAIAQTVASSQASFGFNFATTVPSDAAGAGTAQKSYAALLGGLSTLLDANPALSAFTNTLPIDLVIALAKDMANGKLDGLDGSGNVILVPTDATGTTTSPLPALSAGDLSAWLNEATVYCSTVLSLNGISFNPNVAWNPANPGQVGSGSVTFSGPGAALLLSSNFTPTSSHATIPDPDPSYIWEDVPNYVEILTVPETATTVRTLYIVYFDGVNSYVWNSFNGAGIAGVSRAGGVTTFTNVSVPQLSGGTTTLILNGSLTEPPLP